MKKNGTVIIFVLIMIVCCGAVVALVAGLSFPEIPDDDESFAAEAGFVGADGNLEAPDRMTVRRTSGGGDSLWLDKSFADFDRSCANPDRLISIDVAADNPYLSSVDGVLFSKDMTRLVKYPAARDAAAYTVPEGVETIADGAFENSVNLQSVTLPEGLREIGTGAFRGCASLAAPILPESLTTLKREAFADCLLEGVVTIPAGLAQLGQPNPADPLNMMGECVFGGSRVTAFSVAPDNPAYCSVDGVLFDKEMTRLVHYPAGSPRGAYNVPEGVTAVANEAFRNCRSLTRVSVPGSVKTVGRGAFEGCAALREVRLAEGLQGVGDRAFYGCPVSADGVVPDSVTKIGRDAFGG